MFSRPCQDRQSWDRGLAFRAVLLIAGWGLTATASQMAAGDDLPLPLAESLREAGIMPGPAPEPLKPSNPPSTPAPTTPKLNPAPASAEAILPPLPIAEKQPSIEPAPTNLPSLPVGPAIPEPAPAKTVNNPSAPVVEQVTPLAPAAHSEPVEPEPVSAAETTAEEATDLPPLPPEVAAEAEPAKAAAPSTEVPSTEVPSAAMPTSPTQLFTAPIDSAVNPAQCASCGNKLRPDTHGGYGGCTSCGGGGKCVPGRPNCGGMGMGTCSEHYMCRLIGNLYECLCCPDPCYQPSWIPEANAAFHQDFARPRSMTRFRWDHAWDMQFPDRNEYFWARQSTSAGGGRGPKFPPSGFKNRVSRGKGSSQFGQAGVNFDQIYFYTEAASAKGSLFFEMPYRSNNPSLGPSMSGFADLNFGTKSLLFDTELLQITFQFKNFMPTGQTGKGLGTGHVSLEPSLLMTLRLAEETFLQGQFAEWIPLGGDPTYAGALMHYHLSLNQVLWRPMPDVPIIGTFEFNGWSFQDGAYTDPLLKNPQKSSGSSYLNLAPGLRTSICDKIDFGGSVAFPVSNHHWADPLLRFELRILY